MRRVEVRGAILYVQRSRGWSLLLFAAFSGSLVAASSFGMIRDLAFKGVAMIAGLVLGGAAILLAFRARVFVIRSRDRTLQVVTRLFPGITRKQAHPLDSVRAVLETVTDQVGEKTQQFWIEVDERPCWILGSDFPAPSGEKEARQVAQDLGTPLRLVHRSLKPGRSSMEDEIPHGKKPRNLP